MGNLIWSYYEKNYSSYHIDHANSFMHLIISIVRYYAIR